MVTDSAAFAGAGAGPVDGNEVFGDRVGDAVAGGKRGGAAGGARVGEGEAEAVGGESFVAAGPALHGHGDEDVLMWRGSLGAALTEGSERMMRSNVWLQKVTEKKPTAICEDGELKWKMIQESIILAPEHTDAVQLTAVLTWHRSLVVNNADRVLVLVKWMR